ncbi:TPA: tetratricopeptide repeat protein, partial [Candidatus Aciduliprofundum boonei]|nr:tetratricopeptide repeat protein [Candidatus Aciduliprofundum boonei]
NLASIMFELGKYDDVIALLKPLGKNNNLDALRLLGKALEAEERYEDAVKIYNKVVDIDKKDKSSWISLGRCYLTLNKYNEAIKAFERASLIDPKDKAVYTFLSFAYEGAGYLNKALNYVEKALELDPEDAHIWSSKGLLLLKLNKPKEALRAFNKALEINPDLTSAQEGKADCERIIEEMELEKYARKILLHEYRTGKKVTKKDAFKNLNIPLNILSKVFTYIRDIEKIKIESLDEKEQKFLEKESLKIANKLKKIDNLSLMDIVANSELSVKDAKILLGYIETCLNKNTIDRVTKDDERLLRKVLDLNLQNTSVLNIMMNLNVGVCKAKLIQILLKELEEETSEEVEKNAKINDEEIQEMDERENSTEEGSYL